jgi:hypothetical protein
VAVDVCIAREEYWHHDDQSRANTGRLEQWYLELTKEGKLPERFKDMGMREIAPMLGTGHPARQGTIFRYRYQGMEVQVERGPKEVTTRYVTPYGTLTQRHVASGYFEGHVEIATQLEYPIKSANDFSVWEYIAEHTHYDPCYEEYLAYEEQVGDDGYPLVLAGDCPHHHFTLRLAGYNNAFFLMHDHPQEFEHLLTVMNQLDKERLWPVVAESPARLILHGLHFDKQFTPHKAFRQHISPYYKEFSALLHAHDKRLAYHADSDSSTLLSLIKEAGFDFADCFCSAPMVSVTIEEARAAWGDDVILYGGVPSVMLEPTVSDEEFEEYMHGLFQAIAPGDAFILGVSDNVVATSLIERVERISEWVKQWGSYPIQPAQEGRS